MNRQRRMIGSISTTAGL